MDKIPYSPPKLKRLVHISPLGVIGSINASDNFQAFVNPTESKIVSSVGLISSHSGISPDLAVQKSYSNDHLDKDTVYSYENKFDGKEYDVSVTDVHVDCLEKESKYQNENVKVEKVPNISERTPNRTTEAFHCGSKTMQTPANLASGSATGTTTLPEAFSEVVALQKGQFDTIKKEEMLLKQLQANENLVSEKNEDLNQEISSMMRRKYLAQEEAKNRKLQCKKHQKEIDRLVSKVEELKHKMIHKMEETIKQKSEFKRYRDKIKLYEEEVEMFENTRETFKQLKSLRLEIENLQSKRVEMIRDKENAERIMNGSAEKDLRQQINVIRQEIIKQENLNIEKTKLVEMEKKKHKSIEQAKHVVQKRNAAQLTRLKRQVKEAQLHSRRWKDQILHLGNSITECKQKLEK